MKRTTLSIAAAAAAAMVLTLAAAPAMAATHADTQHTVTATYYGVDGGAKPQRVRAVEQSIYVRVYDQQDRYVTIRSEALVYGSATAVALSSVQAVDDLRDPHAPVHLVGHFLYWRTRTGSVQRTPMEYQFSLAPQGLFATLGQPYFYSLDLGQPANTLAPTWDAATRTLTVDAPADYRTVTVIPQREAAVLNPRPQGYSNAQWLAAVRQARAFARSPKNNGTQYSALATRTQWFAQPNDVFFDKSFPVSKLKNGTILQRDPLVRVTTVDGGADVGMSYVYVEEYVGRSNDAVSGPTTWWRQEQVSLSDGKVMDVMPTLAADPVIEMKKMRPVYDQGFNFGANPPANVSWAVGDGLYAVPIPNWEPNS